MKQTDLFERFIEPLASPPPTGEQLKRAGIARAVENKLDPVAYARELAIDIARQRPDRCCHMPLVNEALAAEGKAGLGNAAAGVFLSHVWEDSGRRVKDTRPQAHGNELKIWRLRYA